MDIDVILLCVFVVLLLIYFIISMIRGLLQDFRPREGTTTRIFVLTTGTLRKQEFDSLEDARWWLKVRKATHRETGYIWQEITTIQHKE